MGAQGFLPPSHLLLDQQNKQPGRPRGRSSVRLQTPEFRYGPSVQQVASGLEPDFLRQFRFFARRLSNALFNQSPGLGVFYLFGMAFPRDRRFWLAIRNGALGAP